MSYARFKQNFSPLRFPYLWPPLERPAPIRRPDCCSTISAVRKEIVWESVFPPPHAIGGTAGPNHATAKPWPAIDIAVHVSIDVAVNLAVDVVPAGRVAYGFRRERRAISAGEREHAQVQRETRTGKRRLERPRSIPIRRRAARRRQGAARPDAARRAWRLEVARGSARSGRASARSQRRPDRRTDPVTLLPHGPIALRLLSRRGRNHGGRSGVDPDVRTSRAGLRRRSPDEFRRFRNARAQHLLRHQRFRRNPAGALGVGR